MKAGLGLSLGFIKQVSCTSHPGSVAERTGRLCVCASPDTADLVLEKLPVAVGNVGTGTGRQVLSCQLVIFSVCFKLLT